MQLLYLWMASISPFHFILSKMEVEIVTLRKKPFKTTGTQ